MTNRRTAAILTAVATLLGILALAPRANAQVAYGGWFGSGIATDGPATVTNVLADGSTGPAIFAYDNFAPVTGGSGADGTWEFGAFNENEVPETFTLDWVYTGFHAFFAVEVSLEAYVIDPVTAAETVSPLLDAGPLDCCTEPSGGFGYSGSHTFTNVPSGAEFGFRMAGSNFDSNGRMLGRLIVDDGDADIQEDTLVVSGWNAARTDGEWGITESYLATTRSYLDDKNSFGSGGVGPATISTDIIVADGVGTVDAASLLGTDIFFTGWVPTASISSAEKTALRTFVEQGGRLVATTDDTGHTMVDAFGLVQGDGGGGTSTFEPNHPIADGPFGAQPTFRQYATVGNYFELGPFATAVGTNSASQVTMAEILPGALTAGSGLALFVADIDFFSDIGTSFTGAIDNEVAIKNLFAYLVANAPPPEPPADPGTVELLRAIPVGSQTTEVGEESFETTYFTYVVFLADGPPGETQTLEVFFSDACVEGSLGAEPGFLGEAEITFDAETGQAAFAGVIAGDTELPAGAFAAARFRVADDAATTGAPSACIPSGPDNDSWTRALELDLTGAGDTREATTNGFLTASGEARWFKFDVVPGAKVDVELFGLPADYDLALFKDIRKTFQDLEAGLETVDDLNSLSAQFAPSAFAPSAFAPSAFAPSAFAPSAFAPSAFAPSAFAPSAFAPSAFAPSAFAPSAFAPSAFAPSAFAPSAFAPSAFAPSAFAPSAFAPSAFAAENFASAQTISLLATSAQFGTGGEAVVADTWNNTGEFYVRVTGKNGAFDPDDDFTVRVRVDGAQCADVLPVPGASFTAPAGDFRTIVIADNGRIDGSLAGNDAAALTALANNLDAYAARPEVDGVIVDLSDFPHIAALHAQADANPSCPYAENLTAEAIRDVIAAYRSTNPNLEFVTLVGSDSQVPFFRYPDQALLGPEQDYEPPVANGTQSQSSLRLNYVLGQDEYGAARTLSLQDSVLPVPKLAVGRLVETASDMNTVLEAYLSTTDGIVTPESSLVTGYDFLTDAAEKVQEELTAGLGQAATRTDTLITPADLSPQDPASWTADQLRTELLDEGEDVIFLAGHFSANSALAADFQTEVLATELADSDTDLTNALVFSNGCHSGYNIVNEDAVPGVTEPLDWTQAFAQKGATLIAGTGYQYGDTDFIEYSERIYTQFSQELRRGTAPVSVGQALVRAKQEYLATTPELEGLHRKSLLISTLFGIPNLRIDMPGERLIEPPGASEVTPLPVASDPGQTLGLDKASVSVDLTGDLNEVIVPLEDIESGGTVNASYLRGPDGVLTNLGKPALPLVSKNVGQPDSSLRGVGFRGGAWSEELIDAPLTGAPATEIRGVHTPFASLVNFPMKLTSVNYFGALTGTGGTRLNLTPVQHRVESIGDIETIRREFSSVDLDLFYSDLVTTQAFAGNQPALAAPPTITGVQARVVGSDVQFRARVVGALSAGIQQVWITHTDGTGASSGTWAPLDLTQDPNDSTVWTGVLTDAFAAFGTIDYVVHAANGVGLVSTDDNFGSYYQIASAQSPPAPAPTATDVSLNVPAAVTFGATVPVTAQLQTSTGAPVVGRRLLFSTGASGRVATTDATGRATVALPVTAPPGQLVLTASFAGTEGLAPSSTSAPLQVSKAPTAISIETVDPPDRPPAVVARLLAGGDTPLLRRTVYIQASGADGGTRYFARQTDQTGRLSLSSLPLGDGLQEVTVRFAGSVPTPTGVQQITDPAYLASSAAATLLAGEALVVPAAPVALGVAVPLRVKTTLPGLLGDVTATVDWGDQTGPQTLSSSTASHVYAQPGVYVVTVEVTDGPVVTRAVSDFVVVYDPSAGFVTGGGHIWSPAGAWVADDTVEGKANFGFVAKYKKGSTVPDGNTTFVFKAADLRFESTAYEWLVVSSDRKAQYKGSGTINGAGAYDFALTGIDDDVAGDRFRLRIWDRATGGLVYDTNRGEAEYTSDPNNGPSVPLQGGSIKIHRGGKRR